jgi:hypothetical protein
MKQKITCVFLLTVLFVVQDASAQEFHVQNDTVWQFENYQTREGFVIGIWPHEARLTDAAEISKLNNLFGFSHIYFNVDHGDAKFKMMNESGFERDKIMVSLSPEVFRERINEFKDVYAYYIDEPNERNKQTEGVKEFIDSVSPGSLYIISGYRRTSPFTKLVAGSDGVMFSSYKHWWHCFPGVWCPFPVNYDQRSDWTDMKERYGNKSFSNWVGAHRDTTDYEELLEHASILNLKGVWLYQYEDPVNSEKNLFKFSNAAWAAGFMQKFERKYIYEYRCSAEKRSECDWVLHEIHRTDEIREEIYF